MPVKTDVKISTLSYVIVYVKDIEKAKAFYRDILGLAVKVDTPDWVELNTGSTTLALHPDATLSDKRPETPGWPIVVFNVDDIQGAYEGLKASGVKFETEPQVCHEEGDSVGKNASFTDPEGNKLSIYGFGKK